MLAIYDPYRDGLKNYRGYDIEKLSDHFRSLMVLKNRFGESDVEVGVNFFGNICYWFELDRPDQINDYTKYQNPDYINKILHPKLSV